MAAGEREEDFSQALSAIGIDVWVPATKGAQTPVSGVVSAKEVPVQEAPVEEVSMQPAPLATQCVVSNTATGHSIAVWVAYAPGQSGLQSLELDLLSKMFRAIGYDGDVVFLQQATRSESKATVATIIFGPSQAEDLLGDVSACSPGSLQTVAGSPAQPVFITYAPYQILADAALKKSVWNILQLLQQTVVAL